MKMIQSINQERGIPVQALCHALAIARASFYRKNNTSKTKRCPAENNMPKNALDDEEKIAVLDLLHSERFVDRTPYEIFYTLLDENKYYCSVRTMYRLLTVEDENKDRRGQRNHRDAVKPELIATRPKELWSWDITKLLSQQRLVYFHLYVILDIFSRYVVGWLIADCESKELARKLIQETALKQGVPPHQLTLHADNGPSMTSHTVAQLLDHLGIIKTHNRPYTSNDNPFSESQFKTLKYCPQFPDRFNSLKAAEAFCQQFFRWYNTEHYHSGIAWLTPETVHSRRSETVLEKRFQTLKQAYMENPARFNNREPKMKQLPEAVYINPPQTISISTLQKEAAMA